MLTEDELRALLAEGEADRIERTASVNQADKFAEAVTAFANDLPNHRSWPATRRLGHWATRGICAYRAGSVR